MVQVETKERIYRLTLQFADMLPNDEPFGSDPMIDKRASLYEGLTSGPIPD
mgnify:CR=1 FL=1